jgi:hypothetical protein
MKFHFLLLVLFALSLALAEENRLYILSQYDWGNKTGFYFDFENSSQGSAPCKLETLRLILGIADGKNWRFLVATPNWQFNRTYSAKAIVNRQKGELHLDGELIGVNEGEFLPLKGELSLYNIPLRACWARKHATL